MALLITGVGGFIGSHIAEFLANQGFDIIGIDNLSRKAFLRKEGINELYNWNYIKNFKNIELIKGDITKKEDVEILFKKDIDTIIHTAAQVAVTTSLDNPEVDLISNIFGTFNMLELARKKDAKFIFTSTNKVYGENVNKIKLIEKEKRYDFAEEKYKNGIPEDFPVDLTSHTPYGCSKLAADIYVQDYYYTYGISTFCLRMSCIYGTRQFGVEDQGWVAWFVIAMLTDKQINIYGNGKQVRDILYVEDLCNLISKIMKSKIKHGVYNIGGGAKNSVSLLELLEYLESKTGKKAKIKFFNWRKSDQLVYISNIKKAKDEFGWEPAITFEEGVDKLINWVSNNISLFHSKATA